jgi:TolB protein
MRRMIVLLLTACQGSGGSAAESNFVVSLRVEPAELELSTRLGAPETADFTAYATFADGTESPLEELVSWSSSSPSAGSIDDEGTFTTVETNGGETLITATHAGVSGTASLRVRYLADELVDVDAAVPAAFEAATAVEDSDVVIEYPLDGVTVPRNLDDLLFKWDAGDDRVSRLRLTTPLTDVSIYTTDRIWMGNAELWGIVTAANTRGEVTAQVQTGVWSGGTLTDVRQGPPISLTVNRFDATGSVLYWSTSDQGILRIPFGSSEPETFWSSVDSGNRCTGCHVLVEARDRMVVTHDGVNGTFSVIDVADPAAPSPVVMPVDTNRLTFKAVSPDGERMIAVTDGRLSLYDLETGARLESIDTGSDRYTHPDWSPDGDSIVFVRATGAFNSDMAFTGGEIVKMSWDGTRLGDPVVLVARSGTTNNYYPAFSPDGKWIAYNRSTGDAYADVDAEIWLMSADGAINVALGEANGVGPAQNSYVRWAPLPDDDVLWLAFSSLRTYPLSEIAGFPQIWVAAIYPEEAASDGDPSRPPFWLPGQSTNSNNHLPVWWSK